MGNIRIKRMAECTLEQALEAWNGGFEGYFVNVTMPMDAFLARMAQESLSPALSVIAFAGDKPVGIVLSGVECIGGGKVAWNGGTAVSPAFRGQGIGKILMAAAIGIYREEGVTLATLEAIQANEPAIELYKRMGYDIVKRVAVLQHKGSYNDPVDANHGRYTAISIRPQEAAALDFYESLVPWQTQWPSLRDGEALMIIDEVGQPAAYCLYKRGFDASGGHTATTLYQCGIRPERADRPGLLRFALARVFASDALPARRAFNLPEDHEAMPLLTQIGFETLNEQVYMTMRLG